MILYFTVAVDHGHLYVAETLYCIWLLRWQQQKRNNIITGSKHK